MPGEKDKKKKKLDMKKKPKWMSSDMYELANDIPALVQLFLGDKKDISRTKEIKYEVQITRQQAGLFLWQLVFADKKEMKENRDLCMKQNVLDVCNQVLKGGNTAEMTPAIGIITACTKGELKYRANLLELKPPAIPRILDSLKLGSASLTAAACSCIKFLARAEDTQPRLIKYMKEMDWGPLLGALKLSDPMTSFGGKAAASDVMELLDCFIASANPGVVALAQRKILECNGIETIMEVSAPLEAPHAHTHMKHRTIRVIETEKGAACGFCGVSDTAA